jgi:hypothetical protein
LSFFHVAHLNTSNVIVAQNNLSDIYNPPAGLLLFEAGTLYSLAVAFFDLLSTAFPRLRFQPLRMLASLWLF